MFHHLGRGTLFENGTVDHHDNSVGHIVSEGHFVGHDHHRHPLASQFTDHGQDFGTDLRVES